MNPQERIRKAAQERDDKAMRLTLQDMFYERIQAFIHGKAYIFVDDHSDSWIQIDETGKAVWIFGNRRILA